MQAVIGILQHLNDDAFHRAIAALGEVAGDRREQRLEQAVFAQQLVGFIPITRLQKLQYFFKQTRRWYVVQQGSQTWDWLGAFGADAHMEFGGETYRAQHAHRILTVTGFRVANQAYHAFLQIAHSTNVVTYGEVRHAVIKTVDGEVAALGILFD